MEQNVPFFSSVVDARGLGDGFLADNLTPRGLVLNLGHGLWACFDTDLLRWSAVWSGEPGEPPLTLDGLAPGSYHEAGQKTKDGQDHLPKPVGSILLASGLFPGAQAGELLRAEDPREPAPSPEEPGRGPLAGARFLGVSLPEVRIRYVVDGTEISETLRAGTNGRSLLRCLEIGPSTKPMAVVIGIPAEGIPLTAEETPVRNSAGIRHVLVAPGDEDRSLTIRIGQEDTEFVEPPRPRTWTERVRTVTRRTSAGESAAYQIDDIPLPLENPWKRNVRMADLGFFPKPRGWAEAAAVTIDGDVWLLGGLGGKESAEVTWQRYASGLLEPMSLVVRDGEIFVFDRHGIWNLLDRDGDGRCDEYAMFCNRFAQTAETREFPNSMDLAPDGSFVIAKGGQEGTTRGKDNGTMLRVSPDGRTITRLGYGLRQPFGAVDPETGLVTASDQQGQYVPSTPLHVIRDGRFYGHLPHIAPEERYPEAIQEPAAWIPHPVNPSGATQIWLRGTKLGPLDGDCLHLGYNRPELFRVLFNPRFRRPQATVTSFARGFDLPLLNGAVNPADGWLYLTGFQVWGTTAPRISGLVRMRHTGEARVLLRECTPTDQGILLRFSAPLDPEAAENPANYSAERWNYRRSPKYGSPHLRPDGTSGQEWMTPSSAYLSADRQAVFVGLADMRADVHQMRIGWGIQARDGDRVENAAYFSPWELIAFDPVKEGFGDIRVDLLPRPVMATGSPAFRPTAEEGEKLSLMMGCVACHSTDGSTVGKVGPSWKGLAGSERALAGHPEPVRADENYLRESILDPGAKVVKGYEKFDAGMPIYEGILHEGQVESLILYLNTLGEAPGAAKN